MPNLWLTHWEALDLASYLLSRPAGDSAATAENTPTHQGADELQPSQVEAGRKWFEQLGCVQCHASDEAVPAASIPLADLDVQQGCLSDQSGNTEPRAWPHYDLSPSVKDSIPFAGCSSGKCWAISPPIWKRHGKSRIKWWMAEVV